MTIAHTRPVSPISNSGRPFGKKKKYIYGKLSVTHNLPYPLSAFGLSSYPGSGFAPLLK